MRFIFYFLNYNSNFGSFQMTIIENQNLKFGTSTIARVVAEKDLA
tara:strand:- start:107168 stop:107302 length:135 start_codon:yes stop_codon:yes gene_type:complete